MIAYTDAWLPVCGDGQDGNTHCQPRMRAIEITDKQGKMIHGIIENNVVEVPINRVYMDLNKSKFREIS